MSAAPEALVDPSNPNKIPTPQEVLDVLNKLEGMDESMKEGIRKNILEGGEEAIKKMLGGLKDGAVNQEGVEAAVVTSVSYQMIILLGLISFVFMILAFFGYKLYTSLVERERRREEKRKQKQHKKKK